MFFMRKFKPAPYISCQLGRACQKGFSLIEVLVAVAILSLGLLGAVAMQYMALQDNRSARLQSVAVGLGREMAELMRGNNVVAVHTDSAANPYLGDFSSSPLQPPTTAYCMSVGRTDPCPDNTAIARAQVTEWLARVEDQLPGARVVICRDAAPYNAEGLPQWGCTESSISNPPVFIKIGWTHMSTNAALPADRRLVKASDDAPFVVIPVTPSRAD